MQCNTTEYARQIRAQNTISDKRARPHLYYKPGLTSSKKQGMLMMKHHTVRSTMPGKEAPALLCILALNNTRKTE